MDIVSLNKSNYELDSMVEERVFVYNKVIKNTNGVNIRVKKTTAKGVNPVYEICLSGVPNLQVTLNENNVEVLRDLLTLYSQPGF